MIAGVPARTAALSPRACSQVCCRACIPQDAASAPTHIRDARACPMYILNGPTRRRDGADLLSRSGGLRRRLGLALGGSSTALQPEGPDAVQLREGQVSLDGRELAENRGHRSAGGSFANQNQAEVRTADAWRAFGPAGRRQNTDSKSCGRIAPAGGWGGCCGLDRRGAKRLKVIEGVGCGWARARRL